MSIDPPAMFPRRILLSVVGLTPQVVTETLYALATRTDAFVPTELHLLTTTEGSHRLRLTLLEGDHPALAALAEDLELPALADALDPQNIHVITDARACPLDDIITAADSAAAADFIARIVRRLTADDACAIHASIAGGRKTMGFLLGYALSLYGRNQDVLSHVLVNEPFQSHPDFYFPPRRPRVLLTRDQRPVRTDQATVMLAEIPFVRLRQGLPHSLLGGDRGYTETVAEAQAALATPTLHLDRRSRRLICHGRDVRLPPLLLTFYACFVCRRLAGTDVAAVHWSELPAAEVLGHYETLFGVGTEAFERVREGLRDGMTKEWFEQKKAALSRELTKHLGPAAGAYLLRPVGRRPRTRYVLDLPLDCVRLD